MLFWFLFGLANAGAPDLKKECFEQKKGRSCVSLGTGLWQKPETRADARRAFEMGCKLKEESACTLKDLKAPAGPAPTQSPAPQSPAAKPTAIYGIEKTGPQTFRIDRAEALKRAQNLSEVLSQAEMEPFKLPGGHVQGYKFKSVEKNSVFEALGFQKDDVVTRVNDKPVTTQSEAAALLPTLVYEERYKVKVLREGRPLEFIYDLTE